MKFININLIRIMLFYLQVQSCLCQNTTTIANLTTATAPTTNATIIEQSTTRIAESTTVLENATSLPATTATIAEQQTTLPMNTTETLTTTAEVITTSVSTTTTEVTTTSEVFTTTPALTAEQTTAGTTTTVTTTTVATTTATEASSTSMILADNTTAVLAGTLTFLLVVLFIFLVVLYFYCTGKNPPCFSNGNRDSENIPLNGTQGIMVRNGTFHRRPKFVVGEMAISKEDLRGECAKKSADDNRAFRIEYQSIVKGEGEVKAAKLDINAIKNRYDNVIPYDSTRVLLGIKNDDLTSDYINANYVSGYRHDKKWIACQGPKEETFADFWQMIWEQNTAVIIMVTRLVENSKPKCNQYWPSRSVSSSDLHNTSVIKHYGEYKVTLTDTQRRNFYETRIFLLEKDGEQPRTVKQFHYITWPDFGVPSNAANLLQFRRRINAAIPPSAGPTVIHCSAGVGRTGTYILIDAAIEQLQAESCADFYTFLTNMRKERMMLIQTDAQYAFAHKAVEEDIQFGVTECVVSKFKQQVQSLKERANEEEETLLEVQFQKLLRIPLQKDELKHGRRSLKKNRLLQIMPYDFNRVTIPRKPGHEKSDYINASYINGFKERREFIATQGPLTDTLSDFWTMVWENQVNDIIMLTKLEEKGLITCSRYWPNEEDGEAMFGGTTVKYISEEDADVVDYVVREFDITNKESTEKARRIRQFHYLGWPDIGCGSPKDAQCLIEIVGRIQKHNSSSRPSIIHCSSGGGRTGVFCCLATLMDQIECEGVVDVFQAVRSLREQRPHMIQTQDQFYFCYISTLQYLDSTQAGEVDTIMSEVDQLPSGKESLSYEQQPSLQIDKQDRSDSMNNQLQDELSENWSSYNNSDQSRSPSLQSASSGVIKMKQDDRKDIS